MMIGRSIYAIVAMVFLLTACRFGNAPLDERIARRLKIDTTVVLTPPGQQQPLEQQFVHPTSLVGEWVYDFPFYSCELILKKDSSFSFHEQGCMGHGYTEGKWTLLNGYLSLTSYRKYKADDIYVKTVKEKPSTDCILPDMASLTDSTKTGDSPSFQLSVPMPEIKLTDLSVSFSWPDTMSIYFHKKVLIPEGDFLFEYDDKGNETAIKYHLLVQY